MRFGEIRSLLLPHFCLITPHSWDNMDFAGRWTDVTRGTLKTWPWGAWGKCEFWAVSGVTGTLGVKALCKCEGLVVGKGVSGTIVIRGDLCLLSFLFRTSWHIPRPFFSHSPVTFGQDHTLHTLPHTLFGEFPFGFHSSTIMLLTEIYPTLKLICWRSVSLWHHSRMRTLGGVK